MDILREVVLPKLDGVKLSGGKYMARCPVPDHHDSKASLSVSAGNKHPVILNCHAGCPPDAVAAAIGLDWADLCKPREDRPRDDDWTPAGRAIAVYDYRDADGNLLFQVCRTATKDFRQRRPDPTAKSGWRWNLEGVQRVLYRLPKVLQAVADCREVYLVEGEKDVHTLESHGLTATCNPGGAGKWDPTYSEALRGAVVTIIADNDDPGRAHARMIRDQLAGIADTITIAEAAHGKDATDHFTAGGTLDDLLITSRPDAPAKPVLAVGIWEFLDAADAPHDWIIPGLLERGDRLILTGFEGLGKSMLVRQLAVSIAAGMHPFGARDYNPAMVLFIDCENSEAQARRKFRTIANVAKAKDRPLSDETLRLIHRPEGIDLTRPDDSAWLLERVTAHKPDVLVIGPFYRLHNANMNDEVIARRTVSVLDAARAISNCALITEAHAGHGEPGKSRSVRPTGSSLLLRWPEFGYGLAPSSLGSIDDDGVVRQVDLLPWRGPRDERDWPRHLEHGRHDHELPWQPWNPPR